MPKMPELPVDLADADGVQRTASTPAEFWNLFARGFTEDNLVENLSPQEKAARTRAANKAKDDEANSQEEHTKTEVGTNAD